MAVNKPIDILSEVEMHVENICKVLSFHEKKVELHAVVLIEVCFIVSDQISS